MLGGPERWTLLVCTAESAIPGKGPGRAGGRIEILQVDIPGAGWP
jgi:hypothetical protein